MFNTMGLKHQFFKAVLVLKGPSDIYIYVYIYTHIYSMYTYIYIYELPLYIHIFSLYLGKIFIVQNTTM